MEQLLLMELLTLSIYVIFMGFCFCDGFKLPIARKLIWFVVFLGCAATVLKITGQFALPLILPLPMLLAIFLGAIEIKSQKMSKPKADYAHNSRQI